MFPINIIKYVETEMRSFVELPFSAVDSLVLSQLSYIRFEGLVPDPTQSKDSVPISDLLCAENFNEMFKYVRDCEDNKNLLYALAASPRFRNIAANFQVSEFDVKREEQFSAITFFLPENVAYIAFRGTDATLIGWKEDFNMAFQSPVPAQQRSVEYLLEISTLIDDRLILGGHSKGGNLAVYSALSVPAEIQNRIVTIYDHDGPGFREGVLQSEGYKNISGKIQKTIPESSIIGMLLESGKEYTVVDSSRVWLMQHDPFSWQIENGNFSKKEEVSDGALYMNKSLKAWLETISDEEREQFVDMLFTVLSSGGAQTFSDLRDGWQSNLSAILTTIRGADPKMKKFILQTIGSFGAMLVRNLNPWKNKLQS